MDLSTCLFVIGCLLSNACFSFEEEPVVATVVSLDLGLERQDVEIGKVFARRPKAQILRIENTTGSDLSLDKVDFSCGCVEAKVLNSVAKKGGYLELEINVNVQRDIDKVAQAMVLTFENSEVRRKEFLLLAKVEADVTVSPRTIRFKDSQDSQTVKIETKDSSLKLVSVAAVAGNLIIEQTKETAPGQFDMYVRSGATFGQAIEVIRLNLARDGAEDGIVREVTLGFATPGRHRFLPSTLERSDCVGNEESRVLLLFTSSYTPVSNQVELLVQLENGDQVPLPTSLYRFQRKAERMFEVHIKQLTKELLPGKFVVFSVDGDSFSLPLIGD
ncbi:MAG: DUF1573 domain-containing protein, partial [Planctomycetota bacterium]